MGRVRAGLALLAIAWSCALTAAPARAELELSLYYGVDLRKDAEVEALERVWARAAAAGYRRVFLADVHFARPDLLDAHTQANMARVRALADRLGLAVVPAVFQFGRSNQMLARSPHLAEGVPVRDALFIVAGGVAQLVADPPVVLPATPDVADRGVEVAGGIVGTRDCRSRERFRFHVRVAPFRHYHLEVKLRTSNFSGSPSVSVLGADGRALTFPPPIRLLANQGWTDVDLTFNSLDNREVDVWMGLWHPTRGGLDWTGWRLEEIGLVNVLRRPGTPCVVKDADSGRTYTEGTDYEFIRDPALEAVKGSGNYSEWHAAPPITTSLPAGTRLRVSWYHPVFIDEGKTSACPSDSGTYVLLASELRTMRVLWGSSAFLMSHDEIRVMNWDVPCVAVGGDAGGVLAANVRRCLALLGQTQVYAWGDMFDPYQNAVASYYLVHGDLAGSWKALDPSVIVLNWDAPHAKESLEFFSKRGHRQILSGYYDGDVAGVRGWLEAAHGVPGVVGVMYTTWKNRYDDLEAFARIVRSASP